MIRARRIAALLALPVFMAAAGCRSAHVEVTVENRTGSTVQLLEVAYPSASFGANALASGADLHYRIQLRGSGTLKIRYVGAGGRPAEIEGPRLDEGQQGRLEVVLLPGGRAEFAGQPISGR
jgi:hypothetical protein